MSNRKHSATGNAGDTTNSQEQVNALYTAHQVHTLANLIYRRMTAGSASFGTQGHTAGHPGSVDTPYRTQGSPANAWSNVGAQGQGAPQDMNAAFGAMQGGTMNQQFPFDFASYGAMQAAGSGYGFHPYFGAGSFGFAPYAGNPGQAFGFHPYFAAQNGAAGSPFGYTGGFGAQGFTGAQNPYGFTGFGTTQSPFGWTGFGANNNPYFAAQSFGTQSPFAFTGFNGTNAGFGFNPFFANGNNAFGYTPYGTMYGAGNPFGIVPHWMFANHAASQTPFGFVPQWGVPSGNTVHDASGCVNAACTPRNAAFSPAPALFYWYP